MTPSQTTGRVDQNFTLTCTASPADDLKAVVSFVRGTGDKEVNYGDVMQFPDKCITNATNAGYVVECGPSANNSTANVKTYMLHIKNMQEVDFTKWRCRTRSQTYKDNIIVLQNISK